MRIAAGPHNAKAEFPGNAGKRRKNGPKTGAIRLLLRHFSSISKCLHTGAAQPTIRNRVSSANLAESGLCLDSNSGDPRNVKSGPAEAGRDTKPAQVEAQQEGGSTAGHQAGVRVGTDAGNH